MEHGEYNRHVVFLMGGWTYKKFMMWLPAKILALNGFHCISYWYDLDVLSPDIDKTKRSMLAITESVVRRIDHLKKQGKTDFTMFGNSLGTIPAVLVANQVPDVKRVILNTTSSDIARSIWTWDNIKSWFKQELLNNNITLKRLEREWKPISPIHHIDKFKDKEVLVYLAREDVVTPYKLGKELVDAMRKKGAKCKVYTDRTLKHSLAGLVNLVKPRRYLDFLKDRPT